MSKRVRILLGGILLALMSTYFGVYIYSITLPKKGSYPGFSAAWDGRGEPHVTSVDPNGLATDLQVGDELIAINGVKIRDDPRVLINRETPPGTRDGITIRRSGELRDVVIQTVPHQGGIRFDPMYYISLLFLLTGWTVFLLRPDDKQAFLLALMLGALTVIGSDPVNLPLWLSLIVGVAGALGLLGLPIFVHFFLIFPDPSPLLRRFARLETWLYLPYLLVILPASDNQLSSRKPHRQEEASRGDGGQRRRFFQSFSVGDGRADRASAANAHPVVVARYDAVYHFSANPPLIRLCDRST